MRGVQPALAVASALLISVACAGERPAAPDAPPLLTLERHIPLPRITGGMNHLTYDPKHNHFFVTATDDKAVIVVDLTAGKVIRVLEGVRPAAAAFAADLNQLCVSGAGGVVV